ncbi:iron (metal) dependent repressor, dtxr family protein [Chryseobacterium shigense]|uniref:Transcriptional regulator MntR n=1 Tax=Chryseobacterium shigense TaxID=297244 RepID=A0A1N7HVD1_9FLAO|nr:metal-dependent transcriptional regulator [Chryseobacterium shigense]PQA93245.1 iron (metal) dependent repressor, dtxr family protein [Chryseobacterium shigense]SIS28721.1 iron (metal) dependent repressor, DtxR family [Chryseobacterium shigense]
MKTTLTEENYLKALFHLVDNEGKVTINELSKFLGVKMPSVNNMMKKFADKKWVIYETYKPLVVTESGKREAALVVRKHRLTEMFLVKKMNFGWENVHEIAEQLEHVHSQIFFDKMDEILDYPKFDPHGEPIPDKDGNIIAQDLHKLSACTVGETVTFASVTVSDDGFLSYLNERKLLLNTRIKVIKIEDFDKSMTIEIGDNKEVISRKATEIILVKK